MVSAPSWETTSAFFHHPFDLYQPTSKQSAIFGTLPFVKDEPLQFITRRVSNLGFCTPIKSPPLSGSSILPPWYFSMAMNHR